MSIAERIAELESEIIHLRHVIEASRDGEIKNLARDLITVLRDRTLQLKKQL